MQTYFISEERNEMEGNAQWNMILETCLCPAKKIGSPGVITPWYITAELEYL